mmetsp:Transcript_101481/g.293608  ORF Transcript_101481/g.293608 Transcript_101481/m.293608 type:complete len:112 (-) Transcript_101481:606-941(-)
MGNVNPPLDFAPKRRLGGQLRTLSVDSIKIRPTRSSCSSRTPLRRGTPEPEISDEKDEYGDGLSSCILAGSRRFGFPPVDIDGKVVRRGLSLVMLVVRVSAGEGRCPEALS